ncbi:BglG family transcription antiterminator [Lactococcus petauri]|uniref:BglG family transcription antiterminator n=1 Tax=Lactococcus petauri TaxID=1940789 RepID=UPI00254EE706|nr:transcription antiterminator [Lactococcus petauri]
MLVTQREQQIIQEFLVKKTLTVADMMEATGASRRTIYRDLDKFQLTLPNMGIYLRTSTEGYYLEGDLARLEQLQELKEFSPQERQKAEIVLLVTKHHSLEELAERFAVSLPTVISDLKHLDKICEENELFLHQDDEIWITGKEEKIRSVLVSILNDSMSISEALNGDFAEGKIASFLETQFLETAKAIFEKNVEIKAVDKSKVLMQFFLGITLLRINQGKTISSGLWRKPSKEAIAFVREIIQELGGTSFSLAEIVYLASIYDVLYFGFGREVLFMEKFDSQFSYKVRLLISEVSQKMDIAFIKDDKLYGLLYAHLKETEILPDLSSEKENKFIKKIEADNKKVFKVVQDVLPKVFSRKFSSTDIAFVTLHFVATLERSDLVLPLTAAIVTSRGRISCEFLISHLKKNFPFLKRIDIIQLSEIPNLEHYDVVFTTEKELNYIYVSRILDQKNTDDIRHQLRVIQQEARKANKEDEPRHTVDLSRLFSISNTLLEQFSLETLENPPHLQAVIELIVQRLGFSEKEGLARLLLERFEATHLAIPDTNIALLHGLHGTVPYPLFKIYDLEERIEVIAMNQEKISVNRVLLLLAPPEVDHYTTYLLGRISSSIIENKLYTKIYDSGNQEVVEELLKTIMTESIQKYGE